MTWKNNRAPLLTYLSFVHHFVAIGKFRLELLSGNSQFGSKSVIFLFRVTWKFDNRPLKTIGQIFYATSSFVHNFIAICEFKLELQSRNSLIGFWPLWTWPLTSDLKTFAWTLLLSLVITPENFMIRSWEHSKKVVTDGQTDRRTYRRTYRRTNWSVLRAWLQLKSVYTITTEIGKNLLIKSKGKSI